MHLTLPPGTTDDRDLREFIVSVSERRQPAAYRRLMAILEAGGLPS